MKHGIKQVQVARETGLHNTTLSLWLGSKMKGNSAKLEVQIESWLEMFEQQGRVEAESESEDESVEPIPIDGPEILVPVSIDLPLGKEVFHWNKHEAYFSPKAFAKIFCDDT